MANASWTTGPPTCNSDATFRAWASGISTALQAILTPVDLGINLTTVTKPAAGSEATNGYEVYKFSNATSHTAQPVFIRFGYAMSSSGGNQPQLTITIGSVNSGGGVVTSGAWSLGPISLFFNGGSAGSAGALGSFASSDGDGLALYLYADGTGSPCRTLLVLDRHRDPANGLVFSTPAGLSLWTINPSTGNLLQYNIDTVHPEVFGPLSSSKPVVTNGKVTNPSAPINSYLNANGKVTLYPWWAVTRNSHGISAMICQYANSDLTAFVNQSVTWLPAGTGGTARTVKPLGKQYLSFTADHPGSGGLASALWWSNP